MKKILFYSLVLFLIGCSSTEGEKAIRQGKRSKIENVADKLVQFNLEDVFLSDGRISVGGDYVFLRAFGDNDKFVHLFSRDSLSYVGSFGNRGEGPGEIITVGDVMLAEDKEHVYVTDLGHYVVYQYHLDSALTMPNYKPQVKRKLQDTYFPSWMTFFSDTLVYGKLIRTSGVSSFREVTGKWNILTGETTAFDYQHPDIRNKRIMVAASLSQGIFVEANLTFDLLSIFDLNGNLLYNVYGPEWDSRGDRKQHFGTVVIYKDYILATYSGNAWISPTQPHLCHVFDTKGNYLKTLDLGYQAMRMEVDEENDRLIFCFDDEIQFAYLDLKDIL